MISCSHEMMCREYGYNHGMTALLSRADAQALGLKKYFTGKPCPSGHIAERFVSTYGCVECVYLKATEYKASPEAKSKRKARDRAQHERIRLRRKAWDEKNRDLINERTRKWNELNREKYLATARKSRERAKSEPRYVISKRMSDRLRWSLKTGKNGKSWRDLVDFTIEELAEHLEKQFLPGMTWENIGEWHIDHIVPIAAFSFSTVDDSDFKACWSLGNLRPLWGADNSSKRDKRVFLL